MQLTDIRATALVVDSNRVDGSHSHHARASGTQITWRFAAARPSGSFGESAAKGSAHTRSSSTDAGGLNVEWISDQIGISLATLNRIFASLIVLLVLALVRALVLRSLHRRFQEDWVAYRAGKVATYTAMVVGLIAIAWIWIDAFNDLPTFLGLISAGIAIALADVLKNLAGWVYILSRRPFRVGDRIEVGGTRGDVIDIRLFRFSLMEVGNWVDADQATGRLVHVPNGTVFTNHIANYTEGFLYIWHEIPVLITFESDRHRAREILENSLAEHAPPLDRTASGAIRETARSYHIKIGALTPVVYLSVRDSGVLLTARFLVDARQRRTIEQAIWTQILDDFDGEPRVDLAYPTTRMYLHGPVSVRPNDHDGLRPITDPDRIKGS